MICDRRRRTSSRPKISRKNQTLDESRSEYVQELGYRLEADNEALFG